MTPPIELPTISAPAVSPGSAPVRDEAWFATAKRARALSWASLGWMGVEGMVGLLAGLDASSLSLVIWAASSFVEALAAMIVIWRFTGSRTFSASSERTAQRLVAGSFLVLIPYFAYEAIDSLINGSHTTANAAGIAVAASAIVLMPLLGWTKLRLAERLGSAATAGEGTQNLICAAQAAAALVALIAAGAGAQLLDPLAALAIAGVAAWESVELWRGEGDDCCAPIGFADPDQTGCSCGADCECCRGPISPRRTTRGSTHSTSTSSVFYPEQPAAARRGPR